MIFAAIFMSFVTVSLSAGFAYVGVQAFIPRQIVGVIPWVAWYAICTALGLAAIGSAFASASLWQAALMAGLR